MASWLSTFNAYELKLLLMSWAIYQHYVLKLLTQQAH